MDDFTEKAERILVRSRELAEDGAESLSFLEDSFEESCIEDSHDLIEWLAYTKDKRARILNKLHGALTKYRQLEVLEKSILDEEAECNCGGWAGDLNEVVDGHWPGCASLENRK